MSSEQPPFHVITNRDIWEKLVEVEKAVNAAATKTEHHTERLNTHSAKIKALEVKVYGLIAGLVAAIALLVWGGTGV